MKKYIWIIGFLVLIACLPVFGQWDKTGGGGTGTVDNTPDNGGTDAAGEDWAYDHANGTSPHVAFNVPTLIQSFIPQTYNYTASGNITGITSTWVNLNDTGAAGAKTLDVQDATTNDKYIFYAASGQSVTNPLTINMSETTCTNCPAGGFILTDPGQRVELYWNTSIYTVLWPITSMTIIPTVITDADGIALTAAQMNGVVYETSAGDVDIPDGECDAAADVGKWLVVITDDADQNSLTSLDASNQFCLGDLTDCYTAGNEIDIDGTQICVMCIAAETWKVTGWLTTVPTDGGAAD